MKIIFWIGIFFPLAAIAAEDIDYFNESTEHSAEYTSPDHAKKAPTDGESGSKKGWGQGIMEYFERLGAAPPPQPAPPVLIITEPTVTVPTVAVPTPTTAVAVPNAIPNLYVQNQLKAKGQEIAQVRQQILQTTDGKNLQDLTGTLHRLEAEYSQLSENLKLASPASTPATIELSSAPTPPVQKIISQKSQPISMQTSEEDVLKAQLATLGQQEQELSIKIKSTPDANMLSTISSQLERVQQNKSLVALSLKDVQRRNVKNKIGFGAALLPPDNKDIAMPVSTLTPSLEQVLPSDLPTYPAGWGGFGPKAPTQPAGKPMTTEEWKQAQSQAESNFQDTQTHTTYGAHNRPLWTHKDKLGNPRSVPTHAPIDHKHLVEKIRKQKIFS
jgi:hypothetical protein